MMRSIVVAGGDTRDAWLCRMLRDRGYHVRGWGLETAGVPPYAPSDPAPDVLIGPMTGIDQDGRMGTMLGTATVSKPLLERMGSGALLAAGLIADPVVAWCRELGIRTVQYRLESSFMWLNTVPTAEGAIAAAIGRSGDTLFHRPVGIIGFGRVGMVLADRLSRYGAEVVIFERLAEKRAMARALGHPVYPLDASPRPRLDGLFNTAPAPVLDRQWFEPTGPAWVIDLASIPGGLCPELKGTPEVSHKYAQILSIPGKVAPRRAAEIIWETLSMALEEEWEDAGAEGCQNRCRNGGFAL
ncbi:dipicolinate synthase subunit DpsA [Sulfobacillus harzensis]|uniref:Hydroxyacid dehydrogenase n=1 Tax=Sulfobacillus harzensis TaxID=2729629 RepID=A0A7Y0L216_9FIRM|nr:dipicolinate synthase subunit DpsA [Sulfobacillus harzensis]NMP21846.1 hydroxyacid dehydrogenase [Sulfobacillus harzensis]